MRTKISIRERVEEWFVLGILTVVLWLILMAVLLPSLAEGADTDTAMVTLRAEYVALGGVAPLEGAQVGTKDLDTGTWYTGETDAVGQWQVKLPVGHTYVWYVDPPRAFARWCRLASFNCGWFKLGAEGVTRETVWTGICDSKKGL